jgi:hypothetical protein
VSYILCLAILSLSSFYNSEPLLIPNNVDCRNRLQKVLGVLISIVMPIMHLGMRSPTHVLQVSIGAVVVIYLDEVLRKGYGLLSAIPLFTTANIW